jgi:hypothetical protein
VNVGKAQREKGKRFEREMVHRIRAVLGLGEDEVKRGLQFRDGGEVADVVMPRFHLEAKHDNGVSVWAALRQAVGDAKPGMWPLVVLKHDRQEPIAAMPLSDFEELVAQWWQAVNR